MQRKKLGWMGLVSFMVYLGMAYCLGMACLPMLDRMPGRWGTVALVLIMAGAAYVGHMTGVLLLCAGQYAGGRRDGWRFRLLCLGGLWIRQTGEARQWGYQRGIPFGTWVVMEPPELRQDADIFRAADRGRWLFPGAAGLAAVAAAWIWKMGSPAWATLMAMGLMWIRTAVAARAQFRRRGGEQALFWWRCEKINAANVSGVIFGDMPEDWFGRDGVDSVSETMREAWMETVSLRLLQRGDMEGVIGMSRDTEPGAPMRLIVLCNAAYALLMEGRMEEAEALLTPEVRQVFARRGLPMAARRTWYAWLLLHDQDEARAEKWRARFVRSTRGHMVPANVEKENGLMEAAMEKRRRDREGHISG